MSVKSFPSNTPQSEAGGENYVLKDHMFNKELEALCGVGKVEPISVYFSFVKTHFHSSNHSLVKGK